MKKISFIFFTTILIFCTYVNADDTLDLDELENSYSAEVSTSSTTEPVTNSKNIVVIDRKTLTVLYEKDAYTQVAMASTTKIMTCIIALENCSTSEIVTVSKNAATISGSTLGLVQDMKISMNDLLYGLMLRSGNDCAIAIAEHISGSVENFAVLMNQKAIELGLQNTNFITPHGLDNENHYTTAYELAILTNYALNNEKFKEIVSSKTYTISFNGYPRTLSNTNELLGNLDGVYGVKTGFTFEAGRCLVSACKRNNLDIIVVVLGADTKKIRTTDSSKLINYIFNTYKYVDITSTVNTAFSNYLTYFNNNYTLEKTITSPILKLNTIDNYQYPLSSYSALKLNTKIYTLDRFNYEIKPNSKVGSLELYNDKNLLCSIDILIENKLIKNNWQYYFKNIISNWSSIFKL